MWKGCKFYFEPLSIVHTEYFFLDYQEELSGTYTDTVFGNAMDSIRRFYKEILLWGSEVSIQRL
jgi:hypothetical protein